MYDQLDMKEKGKEKLSEGERKAVREEERETS